MFNKFGKFFIVIILSIVFALPLSASAGRSEGADFNFDVNPKTINATREQSVQLNFTAGITVYGQEFRNYCGATVSRATWRAVQVTSGTTPSRVAGVCTNCLELSRQTINLDTYQLPALRQYSASATVRGTSANETRHFFGFLECGSGGDDVGPGGSKLIGQSSAVDIVFTGNPSSSSSPGSNPSAPGSSRSFSFEIPNPLRGGAGTIEDLVVVLAEWIFKLAIPIAVVMIVYSGILFLTAQGNTATITKAKDVLKWAVVGLAIILIGSGFISLIRSVLELGGTGSTTNTAVTCVNNVCSNGAGPCNVASDCSSTTNTGGTGGTGSTTAKAVGGTCSRDRDCFSGLKCRNTICQRENGNLATEACNGGTNCASGLICDNTSDGRQVIDGKDLGTCVNR